MRPMVKDMFYQLGVTFDCVDTHFGYEIRTDRNYLHYDYLEPFTKLNVFKGIAVVNNCLAIQFIE